MAHPGSEDRTGFVIATWVSVLTASFGVLGGAVGALAAARAQKRSELEQLLAVAPAKGRRVQKKKKKKKKRRTPGHRLAGASAWKITDIAAIFAGRKRPNLQEEWRAHLTRGDGHELSPRGKVGAALGFLIAAVRYRLQDVADLGWIPADAVLRSRPLSNLVVLVPAAATASVLLRHNGVAGLLGSAESIIAIGGLLYGLIRVGRWWRGVKPPEPKPHSTKE